jgi:hypothetical protein
MGGARSTFGVLKKCKQNFGRKREGKRWLGRCRYRWEDTVDIDFIETGHECAEWHTIGTSAGLL